MDEKNPSNSCEEIADIVEGIVIKHIVLKKPFRHYFFKILSDIITGIFCLAGVYLILYYFVYHRVPLF